MCDCTAADRLMTPFVDGELDPAERDRVAAHLMACPPCSARATAEQAARRLLVERRDVLASCQVPDAVRARCGALTSSLAGARRIERRWPDRVVPLALAATIMLALASALIYWGTLRSSRLMAAELAADHVKCFTLNAVLGTHQAREAVEAYMASSFAWPMRLPDDPGLEGLELVGARPCVYGEGRVAHIMYLHKGVPLSLFMLPRARRPEEVIDVLGHEAAIWSEGDRTFVLIADEAGPDVQRLASFVRASLH